MKPYRILVTGSRTWRDEDSLFSELRQVLDYLPFTTPVVIVHGAAWGLDALADSAVDCLNRQVRSNVTAEPHPADWDRHGKAAGAIRNQEMVDLGADICLAFPTAKSVGTWDCVRRANAAGIRVVVVPEVRK